MAQPLSGLKRAPSPSRGIGEAEISPPSKQAKTPEKTSPNKSNHSTLTPDFDRLRLSPRSRASSASKRLTFDDPQEALIRESSPTLVEKVAAGKQVLRKSNDELTSLDERVKLMPKRAALQSTSGSYILRSEDQTPILVVKPALQEAGGAHCPTGKSEAKIGINPGESAPRELFAWLVQKRLDIDFGVPPVCLTTMKHPLLGNMKTVGECLRVLEKNSIQLPYDMLFKLIHSHSESEGFTAAILSKKWQQLLDELRISSIPEESKGKLLELCRSMKDASMPDFQQAVRLHFPNEAWTTDNRQKIIRAWSVVGKLESAIQPLRTLFATLKENHELEEALVSVQAYEENDGSLDDLEPSDQREIPHTEFYKFLLDVILLNTDRHLDNVLIKGGRLILIDHGLCLPRIMGITQAEFDFLKLTQASCKIEGEVRDKILALDIAACINDLKAELFKYAIHFPQVSSAIPDECFLLLEFNLRLVQRAVGVGATLREIATFQTSPESADSDKEQEPELVACFKKVLKTSGEGTFYLDLPTLAQELESRFR